MSAGDDVSTVPPIDSISGGSHGLQASWDAMLRLSWSYDKAALELTWKAAQGAAVVHNDDLMQSSVLAPRTFAEAELKVLWATTGVNGLTRGAVGLHVDALVMRSVSLSFQAADQLGQHLMEAVDHALGYALIPVALASVPFVAVWYSGLSDAEKAALPERFGQLLHDNPALGQHLINGGGGLIDFLSPVPGLGGLNFLDGGPLGSSSTNDASRLLALLLGDDGVPVVTERTVSGGGASNKAPGDLEGLMEQLQRTNNLDKDEPGLNGAIEIQQVGTDEDARYIVYVPGTDDLSAVPKGDETVRDMQTNYRLIGNLDTTYGDGIREAMLDAGLKGKDVMLVGHSQGGMVATSLAADPSFRRDFDVKHVVTAGAPTAQVRDLPGDVGAVHLENRGDAVPQLDGEDNPDQPRRVTVQFDGEGGHDVSDNHNMRHYVDGARAADQSSHGSLQSEIEALRRNGFLGGESEKVRTFTIARGAR